MISSLSIVANQEECEGIDGVITPEKLSSITNNYVQRINCVCIDQLSYSDRLSLMRTMLEKISIGGELSVKFINLNLLANKIQENDLNGEKYSQILPEIKSAWSDEEAMAFIKSMPVTISGLYYENIYSIITMEKNR